MKKARNEKNENNDRYWNKKYMAEKSGKALIERDEKIKDNIMGQLMMIRPRENYNTADAVKGGYYPYKGWIEDTEVCVTKNTQPKLQREQDICTQAHNKNIMPNATDYTCYYKEMLDDEPDLLELGKIYTDIYNAGEWVTKDFYRFGTKERTMEFLQENHMNCAGFACGINDLIDPNLDTMTKAVAVAVENNSACNRRILQGKYKKGEVFPVKDMDKIDLLTDIRGGDIMILTDNKGNDCHVARYFDKITALCIGGGGNSDARWISKIGTLDFALHTAKGILHQYTNTKEARIVRGGE